MKNREIQFIKRLGSKSKSIQEQLNYLAPSKGTMYAVSSWLSISKIQCSGCRPSPLSWMSLKLKFSLII